METAGELAADFSFQRLWARRLTGNIHEEDLADLLEDPQVFPSAQVEVSDEDVKSRPTSPACFPCDHFYHQEVVEARACKPCDCQAQARDEVGSHVELHGGDLGDIPASYKIPALRPHEFPVVGVYIDPRVVPGFKYRVRPLLESGRKEGWLWKGRALELASIGRGYSRRLTFAPDKGQLNANDHYFWSDSSPQGFAFELEVVSSADKFTLFDANQVAVATLDIAHNQVPQEEMGQRVVKVEGSSKTLVEKTVRVRSICKVEWFHEPEADLIAPMSGVAVCVGGKVQKLVNVTVGSHPRRGYTLVPGINTSLRSKVVRCPDIPTKYTITGLQPYELPVIGTFVDERVVPGFHYRVRVAGKSRHMFGGRALRLDSVGAGYGKRLTFAPDSLNHPENHLWSDSHPEGLGLEPSAVRQGMRFAIHAGGRKVGEAIVFREDSPQMELSHHLVKDAKGEVTVVKEIQVDVKCHVALDTAGAGGQALEPHDMRVSGVAEVAKARGQREASLLRIKDVGLDSQLNVLFFSQASELVFYPL